MHRRPFNSLIVSVMKKGSDGKSNETEAEPAISLDAGGQIILRIHAIPGAKTSMISGIDETQVSVALAARPIRGQANKELLDFMTSALGLRKTEINFKKGIKSRSKILVINSRYNIDDIRKRIEEQINT